MTAVLPSLEIAKIITDRLPEAVQESNPQAVILKSQHLSGVMEYLKSNPGLDFNFLSDITSTDYYDYFEVTYQLTSFAHNHKTTIKTRCYDRNNPSLPSVIDLWRGAELMEREIFDLMGICFTGHPNMKRLFLWEGFNGHPLRKDYL
jgi:NADH-quinone oxidoreductase subunit C